MQDTKENARKPGDRHNAEAGGKPVEQVGGSRTTRADEGAARSSVVREAGGRLPVPSNVVLGED